MQKEIKKVKKFVPNSIRNFKVNKIKFLMCLFTFFGKRDFRFRFLIGTEQSTFYADKRKFRYVVFYFTKHRDRFYKEYRDSITKSKREYAIIGSRWNDYK